MLTKSWEGLALSLKYGIFGRLRPPPLKYGRYAFKYGLLAVKCGRYR
jgi:hypothetical protein